MMSFSHYMSSDLVLFFEASNRDDALKQMVDALWNKHVLKNSEIFFEAIKNRENIVSTAIGMAIAIPHAKLPSYNQFFIAVGILKKPVDWNAPDDIAVRYIFMIGGPDDKQTEYLQILSSLTSFLKNESNRQNLSQLQDPELIIELFQKI